MTAFPLPDRSEFPTDVRLKLLEGDVFHQAGELGVVKDSQAKLKTEFVVLKSKLTLLATLGAVVGGGAVDFIARNF